MYRLNVIIFSLNVHKQIIHERIEYDENDKFNTLYLAKYANQNCHSLYFLVVPYSNYCIQTENDLFLIHKLAKLHQQNNEKLNKMKQIINCLKSEIPFIAKPKYNQIQMVPMKNNIAIPISKKVQSLMDVVARNQNDKKYKIRMDKKHKNKNYERAVADFLDLNGLNCIKPKIAINAQIFDDVDNVLVVDQNDENETKLITKCDINKCVVIGQYFGILTMGNEYDQIYDGSVNIDDHNLFCFNLRIDSIQSIASAEYSELCGFDENEYKKEENVSFDVVVDALRFDKESESTKNLFLRMRHCDDTNKANVIFLTVYINEWPNIFLITTQGIKANDELITFYDSDFADCAKKKNEKNERLQQIEKKKQQILNKYNIE